MYLNIASSKPDTYVRIYVPLYSWKSKDSSEWWTVIPGKHHSFATVPSTLGNIQYEK